MLILIGLVPTAYALNRAVPASATMDFVAVSAQADRVLDKFVSGSAVISDPREVVQEYIRSKKFTPDTMLALRQIVNDVANELNTYHAMANVPPQYARNFRNDMYLTSEAFRLLKKQGTPAFSAADWAILENYKRHIDLATKFIPGWVKVAVAMALGLGTMVGWKRIVVTVGEKISLSGKTGNLSAHPRRWSRGNRAATTAPDESGQIFPSRQLPIRLSW